MRHLQGFDTSWYRFSSGWQDSNLRPPHPKCGAIPGYATSRWLSPGIMIFQSEKKTL